MTQLAKELIIFIVIVAAAASVLIAWAIHSGFKGRGGDEVIKEGESEQAIYRREVRMRNHEDMAAINGMKIPHYRHEEV